jgi:hypothetical protein
MEKKEIQKHTPGPWTVSNGSKGDRLGIRASKGIPVLIADIIPHLDIIGLPQEANSRIMSLAPEMLEVLKRIVASAPITGLPLGLEKDIQDACHLIKNAEGR